MNVLTSEELMGISEKIDETHREFVGSLAKGLNVIRTFGKDSREMSVAKVAKATDMTRGAARRILLTLHSLGYVECEGRSYRLAPKILELGFSFLSTQHWVSIATPFLDRLKTELRESVSLTVLEDTDVVYIARFQADRVMTLSMDIGSRRPAYCTAMGRVLLGEMEEDEAKRILELSDVKPHTSRTVTDKDALLEEFRKARRLGYAIIDRELEDGLIAVSVPLRDTRGKALAAVNVCGHNSQLSVEDLEARCLPRLRDCVTRISSSPVWAAST
jgi:IclR family transcriptional regulator, pca regulon regulatory protein